MEQNTFGHVTLVSEGGIQMITHKMKDLSENLFKEVTHLTEYQQFLKERVNFLEAKLQEIGPSGVHVPADKVTIKINAPYHCSPRHKTTPLIPYNSASHHITAILVIKPCSSLYNHAPHAI